MFTKQIISTLFLSVAAIIADVRAQNDAHPSPPIPPDQLTDEHIEIAVQALVEELYRRKHPDRFWEPSEWIYNDDGQVDQVGGYTALATLALISAGESYQSPRLRDAIDHLEKAGFWGTYAISVRAQIWAQLPDKFKKQLHEDAKWLVEAFGERFANWHYTVPNRSREIRNSLRLYGALGLWSASLRDFEVKSRLWRTLEDGVIECQLDNGGWNYRCDADPPTGSMTAASLAMLFITQDLLHAADARKIGQPTRLHESAIQAGLDWMNANYTPYENPGRDTDFYYYLFGVERVALASGFRSFGVYDWYRSGAAELIRRLLAWDHESESMAVYERTAGDSTGGPIHNRELSFALLFLSRGRVPIAVNKLSDDEIAWNNRPRDVANVTRWLSDTTEAEMNWQIVSADDEPHLWLNAPLLYIASHEALSWFDSIEIDVRDYRDRAQQQRKQIAGVIDDALPPPPLGGRLEHLRRYLELGGTLFAVNEGRGRSFAQSIEAIGGVLFPHYEWRDLPRDHPIYTMRETRGRPLRIRAISNGVRELIILSETDIAEKFQVRDTKRGAAAFDAFGGLYLYASEQNRTRPRLHRHLLSKTIDLSQDATSLSVVHAAYDGNWDAEPAALEIFARRAAFRIGVNVEVSTASLRAIDAQETRPKFVVLNGTEAHELDESESQAIRAFVESGGVIFVESLGGVGDFATSIETQLAAIFDTPVEPLVDHAIIQGDDHPLAQDAQRVAYRAFAIETFGVRETAPRLRAINVDGEPRVIFSREDVTFGLLDQPKWGVVGYAPTSAQQLLLNIALWANHRSDR